MTQAAPSPASREAIRHAAYRRFRDRGHSHAEASDLADRQVERMAQQEARA